MTLGAEPESGFAWPELLCAPVRSLPDHQRLWVALSGGLDSTLLLHLAAFCHRHQPGLRVVHINHQLQSNADETESFCRAQCARLDLPLVVERVSVTNNGAGGIEEAARDARYAVFERLLAPGDLLLMAHHADDQAETLLFRVVRGSGVLGLAGMPRARPLGQGRLVRPLLGLERSTLVRWARAAGLSWVEDPSNADPVHDRNFLRHSILPRLKTRWPHLARRMRHTASACEESALLGDRLAEIQWADLGDEAGRLAVAGVARLSLAEQKNLLRWWIQQHGFPIPAVAEWSQVIGELLGAGEDRQPELRGPGYCVRRFRGRLYLVRDPRSVPGKPVRVKPEEVVRWGAWKLRLEPVVTPAPPLLPIRISTRQGGERVRPDSDSGSKPVKKWLQERAVPPWERARLPLVFAGSEGGEVLIAIGDLWCSEQYSGSAPAAGWRLIVERDCD